MRNSVKIFRPLLLALICWHSVFATEYPIPADRVPTPGAWAAAGIVGGIPSRPTVFCNLTQSPYNADNTGVANATSILATAIAACPADQVIYMPGGTYRFDTAASWTKSNIVIRGDVDGVGKPTTVIIGYNAAGGSACFNIGGGATYTTSAISSGYTKGSTSIVVASATDFAVGRSVLIDQLNDGTFVTNVGASGTATWVGRTNGTRAMQHLAIITGVTGTTITFEPALNYDFSAGLSPEASVIKSTIGKFIGLENLKLVDAGGGVSAQARRIVTLTNLQNFWALNVETSNCFSAHWYVNTVVHGEWRHGYYHDAYQYQPNRSYGLQFGLSCTGILVEDNIFGKSTAPLIWEWGSSDDVSGYNYYVPGGANDASPTVAPDTILANHGAHPMMILFEGEIGAKLVGDFFWGTSSHMTVFRSHLMAWVSGMSSNMTGVDIWRGNTNYNVLGCVIGLPGHTFTAYERAWNDLSYSYTDLLVYRLGYFANNAGHSQTGSTNAIDTLLRKGNYNYFTGGIAAGESLAGYTLPSSLYKASKPSWFRGLAWPNVDAATGTVTDNPAKWRYEHGMAEPPDDLDPIDLTAPTPNPLTINGGGTHALGFSSIQITANTATDSRTPPVQYNCSVDGAWQGWQDSPIFVFGGLASGTGYAVTVKARDSAPALNESTASSPTTVTTDAGSTTTHTSPTSRALGY